MKPSLLAILWLCSVFNLHAAEKITLFNYQNKPPYIVDGVPPQGLYVALAHELSRQLPKYEFVIQEIPRSRLDYLLARNQLNGLVIGANPDWFADASRHKWTAPFIDDANLLVSRIEGTASKLTKGDLPGHRVGLISGHHYVELDEMIWRGEIIREDTTTESENLERLLKGWIDATVLGERTMKFYLKRDQKLGDSVYIGPEPLFRYQRHILVPIRYVSMMPELNSAIDKLKNDHYWQTSLKLYE